LQDSPHFPHFPAISNSSPLQLQHPNLEALQVTFPELQSLVSSPASKSKFAIKSSDPTSDEDSAEADPSNYLIRIKPSSTRPESPTSSKGGELTVLTSTTPDLPDLIVYETSYPNYPLILQSGGIKRAGGQAQLQFASIKVQEDGTEVRPTSDADVYIYIDVRAVLNDNEKITWSRTESGNIVTEGDNTGSIPKKYWKKAVARRADIGVLFEHGEVRKEIPVGLRGKGVKGKRGGGKGKGRGLKELKSRSEDDESASD
jgi:2'-phosphotransferase